MKSYQERYFEHIHVEKKLDKNKNTRTVYVYDGDYYGWSFCSKPLEGKNLIRMKVIHFALFFLSVALLLFALLQRNLINTNRFVSIPALLALAAATIELTGVIGFCFSGEMLMEADIHNISLRLHVSALLHAVFLLIAGIIGCIVLVRFKTISGWETIAGILASGGCAAGTVLLQNKICPRNLGKSKPKKS